MRTLSSEEIRNACCRLVRKILDRNPSARWLCGIPRGGVPAAYALAYASGGKLDVTDNPEHADILVDDLVDSGATRDKWFREYRKPVAVLFTKRAEELSWPLWGVAAAAGEWLVFPWEGSAEASAEDITVRLLQFVGEDPNRPGLKETPMRVARAWREWCSGYGTDPKDVLKCFEDGAEKVDEMVVVRDLPLYSHCEHHLAPFFGVAHIGYVPNGKIIGLSKAARLLNVFAKRLQVQERLTNQVADALAEFMQPKGVGVVVECRHMCMESRGVRTVGSTTVTSAMRGVLMSKPEARAELMALVRR